jgi:hypothetical protein
MAAGLNVSKYNTYVVMGVYRLVTPTGGGVGGGNPIQSQQVVPSGGSIAGGQSLAKGKHIFTSAGGGGVAGGLSVPLSQRVIERHISATLILNHYSEGASSPDYSQSITIGIDSSKETQGFGQQAAMAWPAIRHAVELEMPVESGSWFAGCEIDSVTLLVRFIREELI